jgi:hypothetical protein
LLSDFAAVNLILPSQMTEARLVRTVYGIDANRNGEIDNGSTIYDYFTRLTGSSYRESRVSFLPSTQGIDTSLFAIRGLPNPSPTCMYTNSFLTGNFSLVSRTISVFRSALAPALVALPGQVTQITSISSTSIYEVSRLILIHEEVGISEGSIIVIRDDGDYDYGCNYGCDNDDDDDDDDDWDDDDWDDDDWDDDDDDDDRTRRRNCNQGIGNGAEGCDPGNSRPHGGSNDEDDRISNRDVVTLSNGYRVTFLGMSYRGSNSTWRYYVEELPVAQDLSNWVLELPSCARVVDASPQGELVNPDPNARLSGIKWQPGGGFVEGEFSVTPSGRLSVGQIDVAVKGPDVEIGQIAGPSCGS